MDLGLRKTVARSAVYRSRKLIGSLGESLKPGYGGGWLGGRVNSLDFLLDITDADTRIVPAYGPVMSQADLQAERDLMQEAYNRLLDLIRQGCSASCMQQEGALDGLPRTWRDPQTFLYAAYKGMWAHHYNLAPNIL